MSRKRAKSRPPAMGERDRRFAIGLLTMAYNHAVANGRTLVADYIMKRCIGPLHKDESDERKARRPRKGTRLKEVSIAGHKVGVVDVPEHVEIEEVPRDE